MLKRGNSNFSKLVFPRTVNEFSTSSVCYHSRLHTQIIQNSSLADYMYIQTRHKILSKISTVEWQKKGNASRIKQKYVYLFCVSSKNQIISSFVALLHLLLHKPISGCARVSVRVVLTFVLCAPLVLVWALPAEPPLRKYLLLTPEVVCPR